MARARIEQRRRAHHVFERREQAIKFQRVADAFGQTAGNAHEKVLRRLDHLAGLRIAQEIAVVKRAQAEVFEELVALSSITSLSLRELAVTNAAVRSAIRPARRPAPID